MFDFQAVHSLKTDCELSYLLATAHATWHHSGFTQVGEVLLYRQEWYNNFLQICGLLDLVKDRLVPLIETEEQMLFVFHLVGPFLQRLHADRWILLLHISSYTVVQVHAGPLRPDSPAVRDSAAGGQEGGGDAPHGLRVRPALPHQVPVHWGQREAGRGEGG